MIINLSSLAMHYTLVISYRNLTPTPLKSGFIIRSEWFSFFFFSFVLIALSISAFSHFFSHGVYQFSYMYKQIVLLQHYHKMLH